MNRFDIELFHVAAYENRLHQISKLPKVTLAGAKQA